MANLELEDNSEPNPLIDPQGGSFQRFRMDELGGEHVAPSTNEPGLDFDLRETEAVIMGSPKMNTPLKRGTQIFVDKPSLSRPGIDAAIANRAEILLIEGCKTSEKDAAAVDDMAGKGIVDQARIISFFKGQVEEIIFRPGAPGTIEITFLKSSILPEQGKSEGGFQGFSSGAPGLYNISTPHDSFSRKKDYPSEAVRRKDILG